MKEGSKIFCLDAITGSRQDEQNRRIFAAITSFGIQPEPALCGEFVENIGGEKKSVTALRLKEASPCGRWETEKLLQLWRDPDFPTREPNHPLNHIRQAFKNHKDTDAFLESSKDEEEPNHPLNYIRQAFKNRKATEAFLKFQGPIAVLRRGKRIGLISRHTKPETREKIMRGLNQK